MNKVVFIPLDERPCNYYYPTRLMKKDYDLIMPPIDLMGKKKKSAPIDKLNEWLFKEAIDAKILIVSLDTLIFGGIVPSRLNNDSIDTLFKRLEILKKIKEVNKGIKILAFELIMRCPGYSSSDEEPDYYEEIGYEIHMVGEFTHKEKLGIISKDEMEKKNEYLKKIKKEYLDDYLSRREKNLRVLLKNLSFVLDETIDFMIVPQDDTSLYGYTTMDKEIVFNYVKENNLSDKVMIYPSADDTGLTLLSKALTLIKNESPLIYVDYAAEEAEKTIPCFEDQMIDKTMNYQIKSAGLKRTYNRDESDIILFVNIGSFMTDIKYKNDYYKEYFIDRDLDSFIDRIKDGIKLGKIVSIADVAYPNGSDVDLIELLSKEEILYDIHAYAGWNTSSNTLGTSISFALHYYFDRNDKLKNDFLSLRYLEDYGYMAYVRSDVTDNILNDMGLNYFDLKDKGKEVSDIIKDKILNVIRENIPEVLDNFKDIEIHQPWNRMFETFVKLK